MRFALTRGQGIPATVRVELTAALILHRRAWRDTSLLVEAFAREHGRIGLIAKGARRQTARWRGLLEPLAALDLAWAGRGELYTLTGVETRRRYRLTGNALMAGFYASELVMRLTARDDPHPAIYDSLAALLATFDDGAPAIVALRFFERDLLAELGYGLALDHTSVTGEPVASAVRYRYHPELGLQAISADTPAGGVDIGGRALLGLAHGRFAQAADVRAARALMQAALAPHLGDRPLKSVQTMQAMQQFRQSPVSHATDTAAPSGSPGDSAGDSV